MDKQEMRKRMILLRKEFVGRIKQQADEKIFKKILTLDLWKQAKVVNMYKSLPAEVSTYALWKLDKIFKEPEQLGKSDLYIIPGVAFDKRGNRLGRGGGFYDALLRANSGVPVIGLAYDFQVLEEVPYSSYDVPVDLVITEKQIYAK